MNGDEPRRAHHYAQHRPEVVDRPAEAGDGVLDEPVRRVRMVVPELAPIVVGALRAEQTSRARVVQPRVVQHDEARIRREIRPHVVVARRIAQLIDDQIVGSPSMLPHEVVRA